MNEGMPMTVTPAALTQPRQEAGQDRQKDRRKARQGQIGDVDVGFLEREEGDDDRRGIGDARHAEVDLGAQDHEGQARGDDADDRDLAQDVAEVVRRS